MAKINIDISLTANTNRNRSNILTAVGVNLSNASSTVNGYFDLVKRQTQLAAGVSAGSSLQWSNAWKEQQRFIEKQNTPKEDHSHPGPLLIDIISSLPPTSDRRRSYENLKLTLDGLASNVGHGLDTMTRESYRDLLRLSKQSEMIRHGIEQPLPEASNMLGVEEGQYVSNIQDWRPAFACATKRVSDAMGSHSDTDHSILKDAAGAVAFIPSACVALIDKVSTHITNEVEGCFKKAQVELLQHLPTKIAGNLRHLATALDSILSIPFEIASDVYNGLRQLMAQISDLIDGLMTKIVGWVIGAIGGLVDGLFPQGLLDGVIEIISIIADEFSDLFDMLGGFSIIGTIRDTLTNILSGNFLAALGNVATLGKLLTTGFGAGGFLGDLAGAAIDCLDGQIGLGKLGKLANKISGGILKGLAIKNAITGVLGALPAIGAGLGNIGSIIGNGILNIAGSAVSAIRNLGGMIAGLLPAAIGYVLDKLISKLCNVGMTGNNGYSVGSTFDKFRNRIFDRCMNTHATHASILAPLFNKQSVPIGSYATESDASLFDESRFVTGAQTTKGVTMVGPGGSVFYKPFGVFQGGYTNSSIRTVSEGSYQTRSYGANPNYSLAQQAANLNISLRNLPGFGRLQTNMNFGIALPSF
jgi:hypothetical protein